MCRYITVWVLSWVCCASFARAEIAGLSWQDIRLEEALLCVSQNAVYVPGEGVVLKAPKTQARTRVIFLPHYMVPMLYQLRAEQSKARLLLGGKWVDSGAAMAAYDGERIHPDTLPKWFSKFLDANGLPHICFHDMRHTGISLLFLNKRMSPLWQTVPDTASPR